MPVIADALRPFWAANINAVNGRPEFGLQDWFTLREYQVLQPLQPNSATIVISDATKFLRALAFDYNRMSTAAFETMSVITRSPVFPNSTAWLLIQTYYAAFFAAQALMRVLGVSYTQIDTVTARDVDRVSQIYGMKGAHSFAAGNYRCSYVLGPYGDQLVCDSSRGQGSGVHEAMWIGFLAVIKKLSRDILASNQNQYQEVSLKLDELAAALSSGTRQNGGWLSYMRNMINYRHSFGCWHPYRASRRQADALFARLRGNAWTRDPMDISLGPPRFDFEEVEFFQRICQFLVGMCRTITEDLENRCPAGKSFLNGGAMTVLSRAA